MAELFDINKKPANEEEFKKWFARKFGYKDYEYQAYYNTAVSQLRLTFLESAFWKTLSNKLNDIDNRYKMIHNVYLLSDASAPDIYTKSLGSLLNKAFRKDILNNTNYPEEPPNGWVSHKNWFDRINDILRTTIVVKYLDGVNFLIEEIKAIAQSTGCNFEYSLEAKEEGYYAAHLGIKQELGLIGHDFQSHKHLINVEIQITTELQALIKNLLHKYYEENRTRPKPDNYKWQWDYSCDEFNSNYLGHIVHYVEGKIVELRDK